MNCNKFDITIIGGGLAGVCAGIASARLNKKVALVTNRPVLGGNSSSEIRVWTRGSSGAGNLFSEEMGILGEMKLYNEFLNPNGNPILWDEVVLDFVLKEKNITLFLNTFITDVEINEDKSVKSVKGFEITSENKFEFESEFYIDGTGDGFIGAKANVPFVIGKEDKTVYNESLAGDEFVKSTQGNSILFYTKKLDHKVKFVAPEYAYKRDYIEKLLNNGGRIVNEDTNGCDLWWVEFGGELDTIKDYAKINLEDKKLLLGIFDYIKNSGKFEADNLDLEWIGNLAGKRESRRFVTDYVLNSNDIIDKKQFEDVAFYGGWYMDFHPSKGIYSEEIFCRQIPVYVYEMPFRCLYNSHVNNLLFAGRDIGTSSTVFASSRVMNTCALSGQAAGTLAATLLDSRKKLNQIDDAIIQKAQQILRESDVLLLHKSKNDGENLLKNARVTSEDTVTNAFCVKNGELKLSENVYLAISEKFAKASKLILSSRAKTELELEVYSNPIPHKNVFDNLVATTKISLEKGNNAIDLGSFCNGELEYLSFLFKKNDEVSIFTSSDGIVGVVLGYVEKPQMYSPNLVVENFLAYEIANLYNGFSRPYKSTNAWASQKLPATVNVKFDKIKEINSIEFAFNPELSVDLVSSKVSRVSEHHLITLRNGIVPQMVKAFDVYSTINGVQTLLKSVDDNYERIVKFELKVKLDNLSIVFKETYGACRIEVFEIKIR